MESLVTEDVPEAADAMDETFGRIGIHFVAELFDVNVDGIGFDVVVESPDSFNDGGTGDGAVGTAHEEFEQTKLGGGERDFEAAAFDFAGSGVEREIAGGEFLDRRLEGTAGEGAETGEEDVEGERFDEIIVGAGIETGNDVFRGVASGEHQDGGAVFAGTETESDFEAVDAGHHDIEDDGVESAGGEGGEGLFAIAGESDGVVVFLKALAQEVAHGGFVFGD